MRKKISNLTRLIQNQKIVPLWALANEHVICDAAKGHHYCWKNKSKKIAKLITLANYFKLADFVIVLVGMLAVTRFWIRIKKVSPQKSSQHYKKIFVEHGANAEQYIYNDLFKHNTDEVLRINVITLAGVEKMGVPSIAELFILCVKNSFGLSAKIKVLAKKINLNTVDFLTVAALNLGEYVFFRAFFRIAKSDGVNETIFLAMHIASHACIHEKISTFYYSHGLIKLSIAMCMPDHIVVLTREEKKYLEFLFDGKVNCELVEKNSLLSAQKNNTALILSPELIPSFSEVALHNFNSFIKWAESIGLDLVLRPSPSTKDADLSRLQQLFSTNTKTDNLNNDLESSLNALNPKLLVGLNTTGFVVGLNAHILPVSFCNPEGDMHFDNMIYPMRERVLFWPRDREQIELAVNSSSVYQDLIEVLKNKVDSEFEFDQLCISSL